MFAGYVRTIRFVCIQSVLHIVTCFIFTSVDMGTFLSVVWLYNIHMGQTGFRHDLVLALWVQVLLEQRRLNRFTT